MARIERFQDLIAWQKGMDLTERIHRATNGLRPVDLYGVGAQVRRASLSIPSNIAEGFGSRSRARYRRHVAIALGSRAEVETQLELLKRLALFPATTIAQLVELVEHVGKLLFGLWRSLSPAVVCYSWFLFVIAFGLRPSALGLPHGFTLFS